MKNKNLENLNHGGQEELFAELTPSEASVIEGGYILELTRVEGSSTATGNVCLTLNGKFLWSGEVGKLGKQPDGSFLAIGSFSDLGQIDVYSNGKINSSCKGSLLGSLKINPFCCPELGVIEGTDGALYFISTEIYA